MHKTLTNPIKRLDWDCTETSHARNERSSWKMYNSGAKKEKKNAFLWGYINVVSPSRIEFCVATLALPGRIYFKHNFGGISQLLYRRNKRIIVQTRFGNSKFRLSPTRGDKFFHLLEKGSLSWSVMRIYVQRITKL